MNYSPPTWGKEEVISPVTSQVDHWSNFIEGQINVFQPCTKIPPASRGATCSKTFNATQAALIRKAIANRALLLFLVVPKASMLEYRIYSLWTAPS